MDLFTKPYLLDGQVALAHLRLVVRGGFARQRVPLVDVHVRVIERGPGEGGRERRERVSA